MRFHFSYCILVLALLTASAPGAEPTPKASSGGSAKPAPEKAAAGKSSTAKGAPSKSAESKSGSSKTAKPTSKPAAAKSSTSKPAAEASAKGSTKKQPATATGAAPTSGTTIVAAPKVGADKNWVVVTGESCNLRSTAASSSRILEELGKYSPVKRLGETSGDYEKVEAMSKKTGWVRSSLLGKSAMVSLGEDLAHVRKGPGKDQEIVFDLVQRGYPLRALDRKGDYVQVEDWEGEGGWVNEALLSTKRTAIVKGTAIDVRSGPGKDYEVLFHAQQKVIFDVVQQQGDWVEVRYEDGQRGWVWTGVLWGVE